MKNFAKLLCLGATLALAPLAHATQITGTVGFTGNGTLTVTGGVGTFTAGGDAGFGTDAYVNVAGTGDLATFTKFNPASFLSFVTSNPGATVFTATESGKTLTFKLTGITSMSTDAPGPGLVGVGILSENGFDDTTASFSLNTISAAGTFINFNTAAAAPTPEPSSLVLLGSGLVSAAGMLVRRRRTA